MKKLIAIFLAAICLCVPTAAQDNETGLPPDAFERLKGAVGLVDQGMPEAAMTDFDALLKEYPDNYIVQYERLYALYAMERYEDVAAGAKKLIKHKEASAIVFQMYGNVLDILGKPDEAIRVYRKGISRFPDAASLYLEIGNVYVSQEKYNDALASFNKGIDLQPAFSSNYYRAAQLYFGSDNAKVWGLVYAEAAILLAPDNSGRHADMGAAIRDCFVKNISIGHADGKTEAKVTLAKNRGILMEQSDECIIEFPGVYEACTLGAVTKMAVGGEEFTGSIRQLAELRKGIVEAYFSAGQNYFGNAMYLLPFQKKIIDAGHWEAYNYFIFGEAFDDEFDAWYADNSAKFDDFVDWYNKAPFNPDPSHTIGADSIYRDCKRLSTIDGLIFQATLMDLSK